MVYERVKNDFESGEKKYKRWISLALQEANLIDLDSGLLAKTLLFPVNWNGNHWILVAVCLKQRHYFVLDPYSPNKASDDQQRVADTLLKGLISIKSLKMKDGFEFMKENEFPFTSQADSFNCGVYVCIYMLNLMFDEFTPSVNCRKFRALFVQWLMQKSIPHNALQLGVES